MFKNDGQGLRIWDTALANTSHPPVNQGSGATNAGGNIILAFASVQPLPTSPRHDHPSTGNPVSHSPREPRREPPAPVHASLAPIAQANATAAGGYVSLLKTAVATIRHDHTHCDAHILFDEAAQRSFITQSLADQLGIHCTQIEPISLSAFGAHSSSIRRLHVATVNIVTPLQEQILIRVLIIDQIATSLESRSRNQLQDPPHLKNLNLAHLVTSDENFAVSLLIGADHYRDLVKDKVIPGQGPTAVASKLCYPISSPLKTNTTQLSAIVVNLLHTLTSTKKIEDDVERFWSLESLGISSPPETDEHKLFLQHYQNSSITRLPDGSYSAKFPWKEDYPALPSNYGHCAHRTGSLVRRLAQKPNLLGSYDDIITEYERRGFIERVEDISIQDKANYLPHHAVKRDSATTPIRVVFHCSCRSSAISPSLNDCLEVGPPFLSDICSILIRFRTFTYGLSTNIEKAFLHVGLDVRDRDYPEGKFKVYWFKSVLFGSTSSPFILSATLNRHLKEYNSPVANDMQNNMYVDNIITGRDHESEVLHYYHESRATMSQGHFTLRSWASKSQCLRNQAKEIKW